jgi:hypothetical protein
MEPFRASAPGCTAEAGRRRPRQIPDEKFSELFAAGLAPRALVAFWVSAGVRASSCSALPGMPTRASS